MLDSKRRGRRKGVEIRPGSVRQARLEANLSLAEVAGEQLSRSAINLVELGRSRPSRETLEQIAQRTGKPIEFFLLADASDSGRRLGAEQDLSELERLTATRELGRVVELAQTLLPNAWDERDLAPVRFFLGQALCRLVRPKEALAQLVPSRHAFEKLGDEWMAVEALDWESTAMGYLEDPAAIPAALEALRRCRALVPKPALVEARILGHIANMHVVGHAWADAIRYYTEALEAAQGVRDLLQLAKMHHGLATAYQRLQQPVAARKHFDRALSLYSLESDLSAVYRVENDLGELLLREGQLESAQLHLQKALAGSEELGIDRRGRGYILANLGEVAMRSGNHEQAADYLGRALEVGTTVGENIVVANVHQLMGELSERQGERRLADAHYGEAIEILGRLDMPNRLRDCHMDYAELLKARGDTANAAEHWRIAAEVARASSRGLTTARGEIRRAEQPIS